MSRERLEFGRLAEKTGAEFLKRKGYKILELNYKTKVGEIDIIAKEKETICFVEVKGRHSLNFGNPSEAVNFRKQQRIAKAAAFYLKINNLMERACRFDVLSVLRNGNKEEISLIKNAFDNPV